jgi:hypothetical protein
MRPLGVLRPYATAAAMRRGGTMRNPMRQTAVITALRAAVRSIHRSSGRMCALTSGRLVYRLPRPNQPD